MRWPHRIVLQRRNPSAHMQDNRDNRAFFQIAFDELHSEALEQALWAMVWSQCDGDDSKAKAAYVEHRARELENSAAKSKRQALWLEWKRAISAWGFPWFSAILTAAITVFYCAWCYHGASGILPMMGAIVGILIIPAAAALVVSAGLLGRPKKALMASTTTFLLALMGVALLNTIDTYNQFHYTSKHLYSATLLNGEHVTLASDLELTAERGEKIVADLSWQWDKAMKERKVTDIEAIDNDHSLWFRDFYKGFVTPLACARLPHLHHPEDVQLRSANLP